jgi:hypothetical protein
MADFLWEKLNRAPRRWFWECFADPHYGKGLP